MSYVVSLIRSNNFLCSGYDSGESICDACLHAKVHQLPFPQSSSRSTAPLQIVFSDVWGPAVDSFGNKKYYVSFINDSVNLLGYISFVISVMF
jgi:hypothetical protein